MKGAGWVCKYLFDLIQQDLFVMEPDTTCHLQEFRGLRTRGKQEASIFQEGQYHAHIVEISKQVGLGR